jgi:DnaK suppressor protein
VDDLTPEQQTELSENLHALAGDLTQMLESSEESSRPVDLSQPIGRISRIDAIQQQKMAQATRGGHELRLQQVNAALSAIQRDEYGECRRCEEPIGFGRLKARPEAPLCLKCQHAAETRHL